MMRLTIEGDSLDEILTKIRAMTGTAMPATEKPAAAEKPATKAKGKGTDKGKAAAPKGEAPAAEQKPAAVTTDGVTFEKVQEYAKGLSRALGPKAPLLIELMKQHGANRLSEVPEANRGQFMADMQALYAREFPEANDG